MEIESMIPSREVRERMREKGKVLSDYDMVALLCQAPLLYAEKRKYLEELMKMTGDSQLKENINKRLSQDKEEMECFYKNTNGYVYVLKGGMHETNEYSYGYFANPQLAYKSGLKLKHGFMIEKYVVVDSNFEKDIEEPVAVFHYSVRGSMERFYSREVSRMQSGDCFEYAYVEISNPFDLGDIVCTIPDGRRGIVVTSKEEYEEFKARVECVEEKDFTDNYIVVEFILEDGSLSHEYISPIYLQKHIPEEEDEDEAVLWAASSAIRGSGLAWFMDCYEEYRLKCKQKDMGI